MPSITQLKYITAVDDTKSFVKAAKKCNVSQPSLSTQVQKAEEELGFLIFDRTQKPIQLTEKGTAIIKQAQKIIAEHKKLIDISLVKSGVISGSFKLATIPTLTPYILPLFLKNFTEQYPYVQLSIEELKTEDIIKQLKQDKIDAGILATPLAEKDIFERPLFYEPFYAYLNKSHPLINKKSLKEKDLSDHPVWLLEEGHCFRTQVTNFCVSKQKNSVLPTVQFEGANIETLKNLVNKIGGCTLIPHYFKENLSKLEIKNNVKEITSPKPSREISIVFRRNQWKKDILTALQNTISEQIPKELKAKNKFEVMPIS